MIVFYRWRAQGREHIPRKGPLLVVANHQSYLDSCGVGCALTPWVVAHVARSGLYRSRFFGWLIGNLNTIPIRSEDGEGDTAAMKEILRRLAAGHCVIIFPEGSRSIDGRMSPFKPGTALIVKRAACPVIPAAIEGAFDAWPRARKRPRLLGARLAVKFAPPISAEELVRIGPRESLRIIERRIDAMRLELRAELRRRSGGRFPPPGPADEPSFEPLAEPSAPPRAREQEPAHGA